MKRPISRKLQKYSLLPTAQIRKNLVSYRLPTVQNP